jgi:hypothetical protein
MSRRRRTPRVGGVAAILVAASLTGCGLVGGTPSVIGPTPTPRVSASGPSPSASPTSAVPASVWALTGLAGGGGGPAVVVPIMLASGHDHPIGVDSADLVSLEFAESGGFHLAATFQSNPGKEAGPIDIVRPSDAKMFGQLKPVFTESGSPSGFVDTIKGGHLALVSARSGAAGIGSSGGHLYVYPNKLAVRGLTEPPPMFTYGAPGAAVAGTGVKTVKQVVIRAAGHPTVTWDYDSAAHMWHTTILGTAFSATNLVVVQVPYITKSVHALGRDVQFADPLGTGKASIYAGSQGVGGIWQKKAFLSGLNVLANGDTLPVLSPGRTWIIEAPTSASVTAS